MQLLFNALLYLLNDIHGNEDDSFFKNVNAERAAASVVSLSRGYRADDEFKVWQFMIMALAYSRHPYTQNN